MSIVFYILAIVLVYFSYRSFRGGIEYLNYFKKELAKAPSEYTPFATVICPCKRDEDGLIENLEALFGLEYPAYELVFVVDDENDPAVYVIEKLLNRRDAETQRKHLNANPSEFDLDIVSYSSASRRLGGEKLIVVPKATDSSQKVANLREAVLHADERSEVFVFVDSDARPAKNWLQSLVAPLENKSVGVATGYRWFISPELAVASELRGVWNASIASQLGPDPKDNFCWGGSMAITRDTFEKLHIRERWLKTVSDDFVVRSVMNEAGLAIHFVPQALTASVGDCSLREMLEFTTRQMKLTRVYAQKFWLMSFVGSGLFCMVMLWSLGLVVFSRVNDLSVFAAVVTLLIVSALSIGKSFLRLKAVGLVLTDYEHELRRQKFPQLTLWAVSPFVFFANCVGSLFSRRIRWRGTMYEMVSAAETRVIRD